MPSGKQIRAARVLVDWDAGDLAKRVGMSRVAIQNIERGVSRPKSETTEKITRAFFDVGVEFTENEGVRRRPQGVEIFEGSERLNEFYDFLFQHVREKGGHICLSITDERLLAKFRRNPNVHYERMQDLFNKGIIKTFRILTHESNFSTNYNYNLYKWQAESSVAPTAFYTFGDCLALMSFVHNPAPYVVVIQSAPLADAYRQAFDIAWAAAKDPPISKQKDMT